MIIIMRYIDKKVSSISYDCMNQLQHLFPKFYYKAQPKIDEYIIQLSKYPTDLGDYIENNNITSTTELNNMLGFNIDEKISDMIDELHNYGIIHGDLHENNIVINPTSKDVKFIDLDSNYSYRITELKENPELFAKVVKFFNATQMDGTEITTIEELLNYEKRMWKTCFII